IVMIFSCMFVLSFFFFQAEDGIRDLYVTGVQTCALPISSANVFILDRAPVVLRRPIKYEDICARRPAPRWRRRPPRRRLHRRPRSEERRVGKECRSRWWADQ